MSLILALGLGSACTALEPPAHSPLIIAHRGASWDAPENTLPAYELAWEMGADGAEADFYLLADNRIIAFHDRTLERTTNATSGRVVDMTFEEMRALDAGSWKDPRFAGTPPATLEELLASMPAGKVFYIEIKTDRRTAEPILDIVDESGRREDVVIIAFDYDVCEEAKRQAPDIPVLWLIGTERDEDGNHLPIPVRSAQQAKDAGFEGINVSFRGVTPELAEACREAGVSLSVWTVNDIAVARQMAELGVAAITTDRPDVMLRTFGR